jgi:hypothetical protein
MFDGVVITSIPGLEPYFDASDSLYLGAANIAAANGWWDSTRKEYNFVVDEDWFVYSIDRRAWFLIDAPAVPNCGFPTVDTSGRQYIYGGFDDGWLRILDDDTAWDGTTAITQTVETGDFYPLKDAWQISSLEALKVVTKTLTEAADLTVSIYMDTEESTADDTFTIDLDTALTRAQRYNRKANSTGWAARLKFSTSTDETDKGFQPLGWGYLARKEYEDSVPSD